MELSNKKLNSLAKFIRYSISTILCIFLMLLSDKIIDDIDSIVAVPELSNFENKKTLTDLDKRKKEEERNIENLNLKYTTAEKAMSAAKANYANEKQSFDNWVQTRKTLGSPENDKEVIDRAKKIDEYYKVEQDWRSRLNSLQEQINNEEKKAMNIQRLIDEERGIAYKIFNEAYKWYEFQVFSTRLLFVGPILVLGIFFFVRRRQSNFWPIYFGFVLFSLYAFFVGLVPYLPSYGGYVRYSVGVLMSLIGGYYTIRYIKKFIDKKQEELKTSTQERAKKVQTITAEKAWDAHLCPSCGKDFIVKRWELSVAKTTDAEQSKNTTSSYVDSFCRYCGLELFKNCECCSSRIFAHLPFCATCGFKISAKD